MKNKRRKSMIGFLLTFTLLTGVTSPYAISTVKAEPAQEDISTASNDLTEKQYIILADDDRTYEHLLTEVGDSVIENEESVELLEDNCMMVAELTEAEAEVIAKEHNIIIEEDFELAANSLFQADNTDSEETDIYVRS